MTNLYDLDKIKALYEKGENIINFLKSNQKVDKNSFEHILISYDFQAGKYIDYIESNAEFSNNYTGALANVINGLEDIHSIMEIGVGEATTLANLIPKLVSKIDGVYGLDISWSRVRYGLKYLKDKNIDNAHLFIANLFDIPVRDNSVEVVYTSHSIEPNGGKEKEALESLYRIAAKYVVLLEPSYHFGSKEVKERIDHHGYVKTLHQTAIELGYNVIEYRLFDHCSNERNPTELIVIKKDVTCEPFGYMCPVTKKDLVRNKSEFYSKEGLLVYPIVSGIPCLLSDNAIVATKYSDFTE